MFLLHRMFTLRREIKRQETNPVKDPVYSRQGKAYASGCCCVLLRFAGLPKRCRINVPLQANPFTSDMRILDCGDVPVTSYVYLATGDRQGKAYASGCCCVLLRFAGLPKRCRIYVGVSLLSFEIGLQRWLQCAFAGEPVY
jgi:hypothetical protein